MKRILCLLLALLLMLGTVQAEESVKFTADYAAMNAAAESVVKIELKINGSDESRFVTAFMAFDSRHALMSCAALTDAAAITASTDGGRDLGQVSVLAADSGTDTAILAFGKDTRLVPLALSSGPVLRASACAVIGYQSGSSLITLGNIGGTFTEQGVTFVQFNAPVSDGANGSPVFDAQGCVAGITTGTYDDGNGVVQNLNFAIDIKHAAELYELCKEDEPVDVSLWPAVDVDREEAFVTGGNEFYVFNDTGVSISSIVLETPLSRAPRSRIDAWLKNGETATIVMTDEEVAQEGDFSLRCEVSAGHGQAFLDYLTVKDLRGKTFSVTVGYGSPKLKVIDEGQVFAMRHEKPVRSTENDTPLIPLKYDRPVDLTNKISLVNNSDKLVRNIILQRSRDENGRAIMDSKSYTVLWAPDETILLDLPETWIGDTHEYSYIVNTDYTKRNTGIMDGTTESLSGKKFALNYNPEGKLRVVRLEELPEGLTNTFTISNTSHSSIVEVNVYIEGSTVEQNKLKRVDGYISDGKSAEATVWNYEIVDAPEDVWYVRIYLKSGTTLILDHLKPEDFFGKTLCVTYDTAKGRPVMYFE